MIAKIGHGANIFGALSYNQLKVDKENGSVLYLQNMQETADGSYTVARLAQSFEPYLVANRRTEKPVLHISLNPDPKDNISDERLCLMAREYMEKMGYGNQPFVVFKHTDIERSHIHIVSVCVDEQGKKITDSFERKRSMDICRALEQKHNLIPATEKSLNQPEQIFRPLDYTAGNIKSQIASVVRHLPKYYRFQSLGAYNALLSLFNITCEEVRGEHNGQPRQGLVYFALNRNGEKASNPFKASLFGKQAGIEQLQKHFTQSKEGMKNDPAKAILKNAVEVAMHINSTEEDFKRHLRDQGINTVTRRNADNRLYGITFIDHDSKTVWNGSQLDKNLSANVFNGLWANAETGKQTISDHTQNIIGPALSHEIPEENQPHELFNFMAKGQSADQHIEYGIIEGIGRLLPDAQGEDYEEQAFANRMKKKKRKKPGHQK